MKCTQMIALVALAAVSTMAPWKGLAQEQQEPEVERLKQASLVAAGKYGALKHKLTGQNPEARKRHLEIVELRRRIAELNREIDIILSDQSAEFRNLKREKDQLARRYEEAREANE